MYGTEWKYLQDLSEMKWSLNSKKTGALDLFYLIRTSLLTTLFCSVVRQIKKFKYFKLKLGSQGILLCADV